MSKLLPSRLTWIDYTAAGTFLLALLLFVITAAKLHALTDRQPAAAPTATPTATATDTPPATTPPTATPPPQPTATVTLERAGWIDLSPHDLETLAALVEAEASGMGTDGKYLVACNVLRDLYDVAGAWDHLTSRWAPLANILAGSPPRAPQSATFAIANGAADGEDCRDYPRCRHLGNVKDLYAWIVHGFAEPGRHDLWAAKTGQMLVCIHGTPDLPPPPGK